MGNDGRLVQRRGGGGIIAYVAFDIIHLHDSQAYVHTSYFIHISCIIFLDGTCLTKIMESCGLRLRSSREENKKRRRLTWNAMSCRAIGLESWRIYCWAKSFLYGKNTCFDIAPVSVPVHLISLPFPSLLFPYPSFRFMFAFSGEAVWIFAIYWNCICHAFLLWIG